MSWTKEQYDKWVPWLEDKFLSIFTRDNKASYATKENLDKTKISGNEHIDKVQDDLHGAVASQVGKGGIGQPVGDLLSKEGISRHERGGKDESGSYLPNPANLFGGK